MWRLTLALAACGGGVAGDELAEPATLAEVRARVPCPEDDVIGCEAPCVEIDWTAKLACECTPDHCEPLAWRGHRGFCKIDSDDTGTVFKYCPDHDPGPIGCTPQVEIRDNHGHEWTYTFDLHPGAQQRYTSGPADHRHQVNWGGSDFHMLRGSTRWGSTYAQIEPHAHIIVVSCPVPE